VVTTCSAVVMDSVYLIVGSVMALKTVLLELMRGTALCLTWPSVMTLPWQHVVMELVSYHHGGVMEMLTVLMAAMRRTALPCSVVLTGSPVLTRGSVYCLTGCVMVALTVLMAVTRLTVRYRVLLISSSARMVYGVSRLGGYVTTTQTVVTGRMR